MIEIRLQGTLKECNEVIEQLKKHLLFSMYQNPIRIKKSEKNKESLL